MIKNWFQLLRVNHWIKNLLVLFPLVFSGRALADMELLWGGIAFLAFSLMTSSVYIVNDLRDIEGDRLHPRKRERPLASGAIKISAAVVVMVALIIISICLTILYAKKSIYSLVIIGCYLALNLIYSFGAKRIPVIDVGILASGFVLRILFGGAFCGIAVSSWLFLTVLTLAFFFALGKRRGELRKHGAVSRAGLDRYPLAFLDKMMYVFLACGFVFYSLWTFERIGSLSPVLSLDSMLFVLGIPIAMMVCMKYSLDVEDEDSSGDPVEVVLSDRILVILSIAWFVVMFIGIYASALTGCGK